ncbi:MAG: hypothetical protein ACE5JZ_05160 [Kiloniellales bacterium]
MADDQDERMVADEGLRQDLAFLGRRHAGAETIDEKSLRHQAPSPPAPRGGMAADADDDPRPPAPVDPDQPAVGEGAVIALEIADALADILGARGLMITVAGVPAGASLSAGADNRDGTWSLGPDEIDGLTITVPADAELALDVTARGAIGGEPARVLARLAVAVEARLPADAARGGTDDDQAIPLDLAGALADLSNREGLMITVADMPDGARLSAGADRGDGTWTLGPSDLDGLTIAVPARAAARFTLKVTATADAASGQARPAARLAVTVDALDGAPCAPPSDPVNPGD